MDTIGQCIDISYIVTEHGHHMTIHYKAGNGPLVSGHLYHMIGHG